MPAVTPPGGVSGRTWIRAYFITASSLLAQWGGTLIHGAGTRVVSSLSGAAKRDGPVDDPARPGQPPDPQNWHWTSLKGHDDEGGDRRHLGCTSDINHWLRNSPLNPAFTATGLFTQLASPAPRSPSEMMTIMAWATTTIAFFFAIWLR